MFAAQCEENDTHGTMSEWLLRACWQEGLITEEELIEKKERNEKFKILTKAGLITRLGIGIRHQRAITGTKWLNNETALSVGNDGFVILWNMSSGGNNFGEYPSTIVGLATKTITDQEEIVDARGMEFGELTKKIYTPAYKLVFCFRNNHPVLSSMKSKKRKCIKKNDRMTVANGHEGTNGW